ncbi:MAG: hypothetical protein QF805_01665 [Pirellulaceae bacterium]|nr:hypothetical protein [Pirellulaceae bacterium]
MNRPLLRQKIEPLAPKSFPAAVEATSLPGGGLVLYEQRAGREDWINWRWKKRPAGATIVVSEIKLLGWIKWKESENNGTVNWSYQLMVQELESKRVVYSTTASGEYKIPASGVTLRPGSGGANGEGVRQAVEAKLTAMLSG